MIKNYLKVVFSHFLKYKLQSILNILGMAVGLSCCLLISAYILFEKSYDDYHEKADRIYRISGEFNSGSRAEISALAGPMLAENFSSVQAYARLYGNTPGLFSRGDFSAFESGFRFADNALFRIFDFDWIQGDPRTALTEPNTLVLTESLANKYFPGENPMGKTIGLAAQQFPMTVVGVIRDLPENTHLLVTALGSMDLGVTRSGRPRENVLENWGFNIFHTYILLEDGVDIAELESQFPAMIENYVPVANPNPVGMSAMNVRDIHLFSTMAREYKPTTNVRTLVVLGLIAASVLGIACINFMNISTARSSRRAREIGVRKVMGAERKKIVLQFLGESIVMAGLAMCIALAMVELVFPVFTSFLGKDIALDSINGYGLVLGLIAYVVFVGVAAGSYPAFFLSAFQPAKVLKGDMSRGNAGVVFRNVLVLAQFSTSIILIVATSVVFLQMQFARESNLGFKTEQVVVLEGTLANGLGPQWREMEEQLLQHPGVLDVSSSGHVPLEPVNFSSAVLVEGLTEEKQVYYFQAGPNFMETYDMEVLAGRTFARDRMGDQYVNPTVDNPLTSAGFVLNETAVRELGWTVDEAVGKEFRVSRKDVSENALVVGPVIGVVADAWLESVRDPVKPIYFYMPPDYAANSSPGYWAMSIRLSGAGINDTIVFINETWETFNPDFDMRLRFLDDDFAAIYEAENQQGEMFMYFSGLAIILACFGLFGLAAFNAERRTKEIGVRKVMGGSVWQIFLLLTTDFSKLVLIANIIAWPVAYFAMERWLDSFAYRIDLTPMIFIGSGLIALCIAWVTVGGTAAKAARQRPVLALRHE